MVFWGNHYENYVQGRNKNYFTVVKEKFFTPKKKARKCFAPANNFFPKKFRLRLFSDAHEKRMEKLRSPQVSGRALGKRARRTFRVKKSRRVARRRAERSGAPLERRGAIF